MKKMMFVAALLVVCTLAVSAKDTVYNFTLRDTNGNPYCNVLWLRLFTPGAPVPKVIVGGYYYNPMCNGTYAPAGGFKHAISPYLQYGGTGAILNVSTPGYGTFNWEILVNPVSHTWTAYRADDLYGNYLGNYGIWINGSAPQVQGAKDAASR